MSQSSQFDFWDLIFYPCIKVPIMLPAAFLKYSIIQFCLTVLTWDLFFILRDPITCLLEEGYNSSGNNPSSVHRPQNNAFPPDKWQGGCSLDFPLSPPRARSWEPHSRTGFICHKGKNIFISLKAQGRIEVLGLPSLWPSAHIFVCSGHLFPPLSTPHYTPEEWIQVCLLLLIFISKVSHAITFNNNTFVHLYWFVSY